MNNKSIWMDGINYEEEKTLDKDIETDVLIIGGGASGINTAYHLMDSNLKVTLIEKRKCGEGITAFTTGKLTFMQDLIYHKLENNFDNDTALSYLNSQKYGIELAKDIINKNKISCNLMETDAYVFTDDEKKIKDFKKEEKFFKDNNIKYEVHKKLSIDFPCLYAIKTSGSYVYHPIKYLMGLKNIIKKKVSIYENTRAIFLSKEDNYYLVKTNKSIIRAKYVVVSSHYPFFIIPGFTPFKTIVEKSYVASGKVKEIKNFQAINYGDTTHSIRYHKDNKNNYILYVRCAHKLGNHLDNQKQYDELDHDFKKYFNTNIKYHYQNHDIITLDGLPYVGSINLSNPNLYVMMGYNAWGMVNSILGGKIISDLILGKDNQYKELFCPTRLLSKDKIINFLPYNLSNIKSLITNKISTSKTFYKEDVKIVHKNFRKYGVYIDESGLKHVVSNICPHMKCNLIFNYADKTWDCPCHASRYDIDGNNLRGPSAFDIKVNQDIDF